MAAFGVAALLWASMAAARAIRAAHALAWQGSITPFTKPLHAALVLIAAVLALAAVWSSVGWAREHLGLLAGLLVAFAAVVPFFAIWLAIARLLPHDDAPWRALVPGALVVGAGLQIIHLGTVLFLTGRVERASATYGSFGAALTILVWLYVISRLIVGSAMLNATLWHRRATPSSRPDDAPQPGAVGCCGHDLAPAETRTVRVARAQRCRVRVAGARPLACDARPAAVAWPPRVTSCRSGSSSCSISAQICCRSRSSALTSQTRSVWLVTMRRQVEHSPHCNAT